MRQYRYDYLLRQGFLPGEARELSRTSKTGMKATYFQQWIRSRRRIFDNAKRYKWTDKDYRQYIKDQYIKSGFTKPDALDRKRVDVWAMLRRYHETVTDRGDEYESPWKKKTTKRGVRKPTKKFNRTAAMKGWIKQLTANIDKLPEHSAKRKQFELQRERLQELVDKG